MMPSEQEEFDRTSYERDRYRDGGGSTPKPDPTVLTTEALLREISALRTLIDQRISATEALFETKILLGREGGMALKETLQQQISGLKEFHITDMDGLRTYIESRILASVQLSKEMGELRDQKFITVQTQFDLIERQRLENKADTKAAVDAALAAAKEAVKEQTTASDRAITKSETATSEQLKQMNVTFTTAIQGINQPISDLRDRVISLESMRIGGHEQKIDTRAITSDTRANIGIYVALGGMVLTLLIVAISAIAVLKP